VTPSPTVERLVDAWIASHHNDHTITAYQQAIGDWLDWLTPQGLDPLTVTREHADRWAGHLQATPTNRGRPPAPRTVARKLASVSSWYTYLETEGHIDRSPFTRVDRPKVQRRYGETPGMTRAEAKALLATADTAGTRTYAAVGILLETAIRAEELLGLNVGDVRVRDTTLTIRVTRKGGETSILPLPDRLADAVDELRRDRSPTDPLLTGHKGRWTYAQLHNTLAKAGTAAGVAEAVTPHMLRVTWATLALEDGVPLAVVQDVMGHASADTTRIYDRGRDDFKRKAAAVEQVSKLLHLT